MFDMNDQNYNELLGKFFSYKNSLIMRIVEKISDYSEEELHDLLSIIELCKDNDR